jgi:TolB-like protein/DNA-binding winged helix-turn-helix (wHTH) protein/Flp pilus assembly protein TadD
MPLSSQAPGVLRFGAFEVDLQEGELRKSGLRIRLQEQPFQVLVILLERPGKIVNREELRQRLWPSDTFVDFDHSLNSAVKRLREALGDQPDNPRFVETLHRRGYRFVAPVEGQPRASEVQADLQGLKQDPEERKAIPTPQSQLVARAAWFKKRSALPWIATAAIFVMVLAAFTANVGGWRDRLVGGSGTGSNPDHIQSLAVLPLANLSRDPGQDYFADGMTEALITDLAQIGSLRVISRTSVMHYKGTSKTLPEIGRELKVDVVVEGAAQTSGGRVRITAQLIRAADDRHLWAESYERDVRDVLALQDEVARTIANEIKVKLTPQEQGLLTSARPVNPQAHELYLKGRYYWNKRTPEALNKSLEYFREAIDKDPSYALGYAGMADAYAMLGSGEYGILPPKEAFPKAEAAAMKALELDSALAEPHATLGYSKDFDWDWQGAEREFKQAIDLNPGYTTAHHWYALHLTTLGRNTEAIAEIRKAQSLDPLSLIISADVAWVFYFARRYEQEGEQARKTLEMDSTFPIAHMYLSYSYLHMGKHKEAVAEMKKAVDLSGGSLPMVGNLAYIYALAGRRYEAIKILNYLKARSKREFVSPDVLAQIYTGLGDKDHAIAWLEKGYEQRSDFTGLLKVLPELDPLRSDPRFEALVRRVGLPQ